MSFFDLGGQKVRFRLSPEGRQALADELPESSFEATAMSLDNLGVWIDLGSERSMLVKWQYLATAVVVRQTDVVEVTEKRRIGF